MQLPVHRSLKLPSIICCKTTIGKGIQSTEGLPRAHSTYFTNEEIKTLKENIGWQNEPFEIPEKVKHLWESVNSDDFYQKWIKDINTLDDNERQNLLMSHDKQEIINAMQEFDSQILNLKKQHQNSAEQASTRSFLKKILPIIMDFYPYVIGGSADLTGSNNTKTENMVAIDKDNHIGNYIHYGIREHAMAACMNGIVLHSPGFLCYAGTFLVFSDYCRPAIRMSSLMKLPVVYIMTHDSIAVGEDGPTHQPVEHLASLRAIPNLNVFRPADIIEFIESWEIILKTIDTPSVLVLTRQTVPSVSRQDHDIKINMTQKGAYIYSESSIYNTDVTIFATGSELSIAIQAKEKLAKDNISVRIVSVPCLELFHEMPDKYKDSILNNNSIKVIIEAASRYGWGNYLGNDTIYITIDQFGKSAPCDKLFQWFNITVEHTVEQIMQKMKD